MGVAAGLLLRLLQGVEEMAPLLSQAALRAAAARVQSLVTGTRLHEAISGESPLPTRAPLP